MHREMDWPSYLIDRAISPAPMNCFVVERSTPVVAFGNPVNSLVATLGINPSCEEFLNQKGELLTGQKRRLATWESLHLENQSDFDEIKGRLVLEGCADYFSGPAYGWFNPLNYILTSGIGASYGQNACHIDLVQWATKPVWRYLDVSVRSKLLDDGVEFLKHQLRTENYRLVLVNGRTALNAVEAAGVISWQPTGITLRKPTTELFIGENGNQRFLGWSCNLQSQPGARRHIDALASFVKERAGFSLFSKPAGGGGNQ